MAYDPNDPYAVLLRAHPSAAGGSFGRPYPGDEEAAAATPTRRGPPPDRRPRQQQQRAVADEETPWQRLLRGVQGVGAGVGPDDGPNRWKVALAHIAANLPALFQGGPVNMSVIEGYNEERGEQRETNKTVAYLRQGGRDDLADAVLAGYDPRDALDQLMARPKEKQLVNVGDGRLYDPNTGKWISAPDSGQQFQLITGDAAKALGLDPEKAYQRNPKNGQITAVGGGGVNVNVGGADLKEYEQKTYTFLNRGLQAHNEMLQFEKVGLNTMEYAKALFNEQVLGDAIPPSLLNDPNYAAFRNASRRFVTAVLRKESGAVIGPEEWKTYFRDYAPMPGDRPEILAMKEKARRGELISMQRGLPEDVRMDIEIPELTDRSIQTFETQMPDSLKRKLGK